MVARTRPTLRKNKKPTAPHSRRRGLRGSPLKPRIDSQHEIAENMTQASPNNVDMDLHVISACALASECGKMAQKRVVYRLHTLCYPLLFTEGPVHKRYPPHHGTKCDFCYQEFARPNRPGKLAFVHVCPEHHIPVEKDWSDGLPPLTKTPDDSEVFDSNTDETGSVELAARLGRQSWTSPHPRKRSSS